MWQISSLCTVSVRLPTNEDVDSEYVLHPTDLPRALGTLAPAQRQQASKTKKDKRFVDTAAAFATAEA